MNDPRKDFLARLATTTAKKVRTVATKKPVGEIIDVVPTSMESVNNYLLCGGFPVRRITEIVGDEGVGKTSLLFDALGHAQRIGWNTVLYETESRFDSRRLSTFNVDDHMLVLEEPNHLDDLVKHLYSVLAASKGSKVPTIIGWDSLANTCTATEWKEGVKSGPEGAMRRAGQLSQQLRILDRMVAQSNCALILTNQLRTKKGVTFGDPRESVGGDALKYAATFRLRFYGGQTLKRGSEIIGKAPVVHTLKSHGVKPFRKARMFLVFDQGYSNERTLLEHGRDRGIIDDSDPMSAANLAYIRDVSVAAGWEPHVIPHTMAQFKLDGRLSPAEEKAFEAAKAKVAKKKVAKKKIAKKVSAKKKASKGAKADG